MDLYVTLVRFFQDGGVFMYPIAAVMAIGIAIALERWFYLLNADPDQPPRLRADPAAAAPAPPARGVRDSSRSRSPPMSRSSPTGSHAAPARDAAPDIEYAMEEGLLEVLPRIERRTAYLATFANIATLLGLLGTIIGLIAAFTAVANADPAEKATLLSQSISVAMNTTAFGLIVAIPLLLMHSVLQSKTSAIVESLEIAMVKFLNLMDCRRSSVAVPSHDALKTSCREHPG